MFIASIKWKGFAEHTWEPAANIRVSIVQHAAILSYFCFSSAQRHSLSTNSTALMQIMGLLERDQTKTAARASCILWTKFDVSK